MGVIRQALFAPRDREALLAALSAPATRAVTLTLSEKGYCLAADGTLDFSHPDILADLATPQTPRSAIGWLALALEQRRKSGAGPLTILSFDNLASNGEKLADAVFAFAERTHPGLAQSTEANAAFPLTLVDCIVPAAMPPIAPGRRSLSMTIWPACAGSLRHGYPGPPVPSHWGAGAERT